MGLLCSRSQFVDRNMFYLKNPSTSGTLRNSDKIRIWLDLNDIDEEGKFVNSDGSQPKFLEWVESILAGDKQCSEYSTSVIIWNVYGRQVHLDGNELGRNYTFLLSIWSCVTSI